MPAVAPEIPPAEQLVRWIESLGWKARLVPLERLRELREAIAGRHARGELDEAFHAGWLRGFDYEPPAGLPGARSIVVIAVPTPPMRLFFERRGARVPVLIPPTYVAYTRRKEAVQEAVTGWLERAGFRAAAPRLPLKTLAVACGLAAYGRNNVGYVPGMGSYLELVGLFTDLPGLGDPWGEPRMLERCGRCEICRERCPTGAIGADRVLLRAERCLTFHNESPADFPDWIRPSWHNCLLGCLLCQDRCPENARVCRRLEDRGEFSEEETAALLRRDGSLPAPLAARIEALAVNFDARVLGRNLAALFAARDAGAAGSDAARD